MAEQDNVSRPIQVFLDTGQFISLRESRPGGGNRDFFVGDNPGFSRHKSAMRQRIRDASATLRRDGQAAGFVIVQMREAALAKSYRPLNALFSRAYSFRLVGGGGIGENFFQCTPSALDRLDHRIETRAELEPRLVENEETGDFEPRPSAYRSELGGIEDIRLPAPADRIAFSAREAAEWLDRPDTLGAYLVELFRPDQTRRPCCRRLDDRGLSPAPRPPGGRRGLAAVPGRKQALDPRPSRTVHSVDPRRRSVIDLASPRRPAIGTRRPAARGTPFGHAKRPGRASPGLS